MKVAQIAVQFHQLHRPELARIVIAQLRPVVEIENHMDMLGQRFFRPLDIKLSFHPHVRDEIDVIHLKNQVFPAP